MVRAGAADFVRGQIAEATAAGAKALIDPAGFAADDAGTPYMAPQILTGVDHSMRVMTEESFGPVVGVMKVASDEEAITLMNDSAFGLTAAIWTEDLEAAIRLGDAVETGTWFMNRCDYLDPALAWSGVKDSGRGCSLEPPRLRAPHPAQIIPFENCNLIWHRLAPDRSPGHRSARHLRNPRHDICRPSKATGPTPLKSFSAPARSRSWPPPARAWACPEAAAGHRPRTRGALPMVTRRHCRQRGRGPADRPLLRHQAEPHRPERRRRCRRLHDRQP